MLNQTEVTHRHRKFLPWVAALGIFMQTLDGTILNTSLPTIAREIGKSPIEMQSVIVSYMLTSALLIPLSGWLSDRFGSKRVFRIAVILFTLGSLLCAMSNSLSGLVLSRIVQAIGGSMMVPVARLAILYAFPKKELLKVINFITIPGLIGPLLGPTLGGVFVETLSWHWIFLVNIPVGLVVFILSGYGIPNFTKPVFRFDSIGLVLLGSAMVLITLVFELGPNQLISYKILALILLAAMLVGMLYVRHAKRKQHPLIDLNLFKIRTLSVSLLGNIFTRMGIGGIPLLIPLMLQVGYGYSATIAGMMMIPSALANLTAKSLVVPIVNRLGYKKTLISNTLILGVIFFGFFILKSEAPIYHIIPLMVIQGFFSSIQFTAMNTLTLADLDDETSSEGNALLALTQQMSMSLGVSVASFILILFQNVEAYSKIPAITFRYTFLVLGIITLLSTLIFLQLKATDGSNMSGKSV
ncbi:DHA2 family efflux MFS transporter permease subunit [Vaginella massiliensis]|uniref:DHA2 family efflux MFS transporter permease subunit n=1 Tax=Vaginella massiliensis TaxID=1816680 RepID=UPI0037535D49